MTVVSDFIVRSKEEWLESMIRKMVSLLLLPVGWTLYLLSYWFPRSPTLVVFGVHTNSYSGNVRALLERPSPHLDKVFISSSKSLAAELNEKGVQAYWRYSFRGALACLRANTYVFSNYPSDINFWLSGGARLVNVWHGTPIKKIEKDISTGYYGLRNRHEWLVKLVAPYLLKESDTLLASSPYEEECFKTAFEFDENKFSRCFPPRLERFVMHPTEHGGPIKILYAPTWRDDHSFSITDHLEFSRLSSFLVRQDAHLYIKLHPSDKTPPPGPTMDRISVLSQHGDIYQDLNDAQMVITDYSSMMFDALYLGKSVTLFTPDISNYLENSRSFYIDPTKDLGLASAENQQTLETLIEKQIYQGIQPIDLVDRFSPYPVCLNLDQILLPLTSQE